MNDYIEVRYDLAPCSEDITDVLAALLADEGFESFVPDGAGLTAYAPAASYSAEAEQRALAMLPFEVDITRNVARVEGRDWNEEWEKNYFKPIVIGERCAVHSSFHTDVPCCEYDIVIDPKMAFGTGHHATTSLMAGYLLDSDLWGKSVIDMGTGTGILAILAAKSGAEKVSAIEIDPPAFDNARENVRLNGHAEICVLLGDASRLAEVSPADIFMANINRNVILGDMDSYAGKVKAGGTMLLSGFFLSDVPMLVDAARPYGLEPAETRNIGDWAALRLIKQLL